MLKAAVLLVKDAFSYIQLTIFLPGPKQAVMEKGFLHSINTDIPRSSPVNQRLQLSVLQSRLF